MNTFLDHPTSARFESNRTLWQAVTTLTLTFWLSSSLCLDFLIMPGLYAAGMMSQPDFVGAGYLIFWVFNRIEILCAALILTGIFILRSNQTAFSRKGYIGSVLGAVLLAIALIYTYGLTPQMSTLGLQLNLFDSSLEVPVLMDQLHGGYWFLESLKYLLGSFLLHLSYRQRI